ncbi:MAG: hypothetical protein AAF688_01005 [Bacteroidota bacterium]
MNLFCFFKTSKNVFVAYNWFFVPFLALCGLIGFGTEVNDSRNSGPEKIYLQLDDVIYSTGSTIWFNGIVVDAQTHASSTVSGIVYVEFIDSNKEILERKIIKAKDGRIEGYFNIGRNLPSGLYLVRAYSNWNRNFDANFNFDKYIYLISTNKPPESILKPIERIEIIDSNGTETKLTARFNPYAIDPEHRGKSLKISIYQDGNKTIERLKNINGIGYQLEYDIKREVSDISLEMETSNGMYFKEDFSINASPVSIKFYPESQILLEGQACRVAFKANDNQSNGVQVEGTIVDDLGNTMSKFKSNPFGVGSFVLRNLDSKRIYTAQLIYDGELIDAVFPLPKVKLKGTLLNVVTDPDAISLFINSNSIKNKKVDINLHCRGKKYIAEEVFLKQGKAKVLIPKSALPKGVIKIEILNGANSVLERFVYNNGLNQEIPVNIKGHKENYQLRDKVKLDLELNEALKVYDNYNLSILVRQKKEVHSKNVANQNIASHLMLSSDFNTNADFSSYYLKPANRKSLDDLMLTMQPDNYNYLTGDHQIKFKKEQQLEIRGVINPIKKSNQEQKIDLLFMALDDNRDVYIKEVTVPGNFQLPIEDTFGSKVRFLVQPNGIEQEGKKQYRIAFNKSSIPDVDFDFSKYSFFEPEVVLSKLEAYRDNKRRTEDFNFKYFGSTELDEVIIDAYKMTPQRKKVADEHGLPRQVIEEKELKEKTPNWHYGLFSIFEASFQETMIQSRFRPDGTLDSYIGGVQKTLFLVDGILVRPEVYDFIQQIDPSELTSVEVLDAPKNAIKLYLRAYPRAIPPYPTIGIISMYSKAGEGIFGALDKGKNKYEIVEIPVFTDSLQFQMPEYSYGDFSESTLIDLRVPLYYNPNITIDSGGMAAIEFYNSDIAGNFEIFLEGSNGKGDFWQKSINYKVSGNTN